MRRIDALVWIEDPDGVLRRGLCASYAAGLVAIEDRAEIREVQVRRRLLTPSAGAVPLETEAGAFLPEPVAGESGAQLSSGLQERLRRLEIEVALREKGFDLLVVDGDPLKDLGLFQDGGPHLAAILKAGKFHNNAL